MPPQTYENYINNLAAGGNGDAARLKGLVGANGALLGMAAPNLVPLNSQFYEQYQNDMSNTDRGALAPGTTTTTDTNTSAPSGGTAYAPLNTAGVNNTQIALDQLPTLLKAALDAEGTRYGNTIGEFNTQEAGQRKTYEGSTNTNQLNYDSNFMDSIRAGIKGLGGIMSLLRGTGAGGGTAEEVARDTVGGVTANDIRGGADTQKENQVQLDTSLTGYLSELDRKRKLAEDTRVNNERAVTRDSNTQMQDLYSKMAGFYSDAGNTGEATNWMNRAGALTPTIAANSMTQVSPYDTAPITVKAPELTAFSGATQPSVQTSSDGQVGAGLFTMGEPRRRRELSLAGV